MGYSTYFTGRIELNKHLTVSTIETLRAIREGSKTLPGMPQRSDCPWVVCRDGKGIESANEEKMYDWKEWLVFLLRKVIEPEGYQATGRVFWHGEEAGDAGVIFVRDNRAKFVSVQDVPEPRWDV